MIAKHLISDKIPPLKTSDSGDKALHWMNELHVNHLPIVNNKQLLGMISEDDILDLKDSSEAIGTTSQNLHRPFVYEYQHIYDVIKIITEQNLTLMPVLDENEDYVGLITLERIVKCFATMSSIQEPGGIIVLDVSSRDYSLSEIAQIIESNDANVLSCYISTHAQSKQLEITLKINKLDLKEILATFDRYNYEVVASFQETEHTEYLKDRLDSLMNYLNM